MKLPLLQILERLYQKVKINRLWAVKVIIICMGLAVLLGSQGLVERVLFGPWMLEAPITIQGGDKLFYAP